MLVCCLFTVIRQECWLFFVLVAGLVVLGWFAGLYLCDFSKADIWNCLLTQLLEYTAYWRKMWKKDVTCLTQSHVHFPLPPLLPPLSAPQRTQSVRVSARAKAMSTAASVSSWALPFICWLPPSSTTPQLWRPSPGTRLTNCCSTPRHPPPAHRWVQQTSVTAALHDCMEQLKLDEMRLQLIWFLICCALVECNLIITSIVYSP